MSFKKGIPQNQEVLIPRKACDYLPENHLAKVIYTVVDKLELSNIYTKYSEIGQNAYNPKMMLRLLFYHYSIGTCSSRKISNSCYERLDTMYLSDGLTPSHDRISDFRKENLDEIKDLFVQIVIIGNELGLVKFNNINASIDGTKLKANASSKLSKTEDEFEKLHEKINKEISELLEKANKIDEEEDNESESEIIKKINSGESRKKAIDEAIKKIQQKKDLMKHNIIQIKNREPTEAELKRIEKQKINSTDNDAKFMKQRNGLIKPAYNGQIVVDEQEQFILANDVTTDCNDQHQLIFMIEETIKNINCNPKSLKGDNGFFPELEIATRLYPEINFFIDDRNRRKKDIDYRIILVKYSEEKLLNLLKLLSPEGEKEYKKRMHTVEPVFGNLKENTGIKTFLLRGISKVKGEFNLMCIGHNLKKITKFINKNNLIHAIATQKIQKKQKNNNKNEFKTLNMTFLQKKLELFSYKCLN